MNPNDDDDGSITVSLSGRIAERNIDGEDDDNLDASPVSATIEVLSGSLRVTTNHTSKPEPVRDMDLLPNMELEGVAHRWRRQTATRGKEILCCWLRY